MYKQKCVSLEDTKALAYKFANLVKDEGCFVNLFGEIGAGKTAFVKLVAEALGIKEKVTIPSFVILNEYHSASIPVYHFDLYRLENVGIKTITDELREYSTGRKITFVEWAEFSQGELPFERIEINVTYDDDDSRIYEFKSVGERNQKVIEGLGVICSSRKGKKLKILAFDTCLDKTYITLSEDDKIIHSETILSDGKNYHSAYLISTIVKILKDAGLTPDDIELITTDIGPGSFTGIRACTTVARVLAQQLNIKAAGVSSLEILSKILGGNDLVALDARKNKAYVYDGKILGAIELEEVDELVKGRRVVTDDSLKERLSGFASEAVSYQQGEYPIGENLAKLGAKKEETDWRKLKPLYIQPPPVTLKK